MKNAAVKIALFTLGASVIWILFEHMMGWNNTNHAIGQYSRTMPMILFWIMLVVCIWYVRRGHGNSLTFKEGFQSGLIMTLIYCFGFTIVIILYQQFLNPEYYQTLKDFTMQQLQSKGASQSEIDSALKELEMSQSGTPLSYLLLFVFSTLWGIGISAIASAILMKKPKTA
ncbi:MAG: DUF4199 domain-containing protein [Chitinophagales bacterium]